MISKVKRYVSRHAANMFGWSTNRKIVVIESDDWGSIRMPSKNIYQECLKAGYRVDEIAYERYDSLASEDDLELLFDVLNKYKDQTGRPAVMTANILTANPDFEKIKSAGFQKYYYELVADTFDRYPNHSGCLDLWKEGKERGLFYPQSHGREHLNVSGFMEALREGNEDALFGFNHRMPGSIPLESSKGGNKFVESLRYTNPMDKGEKLSIVIEGLNLFEELMGHKSKSFMPPNYLWSPDFNEAMSQMGVRYYQGIKNMKEPLFDGTVQIHSHKLGEVNQFGQKYLMRNATFEPALNKDNDDTVDKCLKDISIAFRMNKPAVICSHRLNYVGFIDEKNRDRNLGMLDELLHTIKKRWPDIEFKNSDQLGMLIEKNS
ncbi:hypothetical protein [Fodinibius salsisoli]|uniref:Polysaccharide (De)acetylase n=1 Tax=Fodinibius salsisoli TaxID=2820877 RepID=A0ABT3PLF5_9BACT|nr:hypothetical protein [Fodinibius salsisoli]MCW9706762.1 hypothetical protein [Fodinibius salsisoli]